MARKRKNRTHLKGGAGVQATGSASGGAASTPKSFIIKHGPVGAGLTQLVRDFRKVMEPNTASRLKERNRNKLKDYLTMAPALQVTHLIAFTLTPLAPSLRIVRLTAGPTLSFRVERYSLMKDILNTSKRARSIGMEYLSSPLLVLSSFPAASPTTPPHLPLLMKSFQSLFPPLQPKTITLSSARRVVLVAYNAESDTVDMRHFIITVKAYGVSKRVRRVLETSTSTTKKGGSSHGFLDLGNEKDVADFLLRRRGDPVPDGASDAGYESAASSAAGDDDTNNVSLADDYVGRNNKKGQRRAVRLDEVGPRMELKLVKIAEGIPGKEGSVIYHEHVQKTAKEIAALTAAHAAKTKLRKERREEQEANVKRKKMLAGGSTKEDEDENEIDGLSDVSENYDKPEDDDWDEEEEIDEDNAESSDEDNDSIMGQSSASEDEEEKQIKRPKKKPRKR